MKYMKAPEKMVLVYIIITLLSLFIFSLVGIIKYKELWTYILNLIFIALIIGLSVFILGTVFKLDIKRILKTLSILVGIVIVFVAEYMYNIIATQTSNIGKIITFTSAFLTLFVAIYYALGKFELS